MLKVDVFPVGGVKDAMSPAGKPDKDNPTFPEKPFGGTTVIEVSASVHWLTVRLDGDRFNVKLGGGTLFGVGSDTRAAGGTKTDEHDERSNRKPAIDAMNESLQRARVGEATLIDFSSKQSDINSRVFPPNLDLQELNSEITKGPMSARKYCYPWMVLMSYVVLVTLGSQPFSGASRCSRIRFSRRSSKPEWIIL